MIARRRRAQTPQPDLPQHPSERIGASKPRNNDSTADVLRTIGKNIRRLRKDHRLTLQELAQLTALSTSMLSLIERGKAAPSIGTLVVIASALEAQTSELLNGNKASEDPVSRAASQRVIRTKEGVLHRVVKTDRTRGLEIVINEFGQGMANSQEPVAHAGFEYGFLLEGALEVSVNGQIHTLRRGDLICYPSTYPHHVVNRGAARARAIWINLRKA